MFLPSDGKLFPGIRVFIWAGFLSKHGYDVFDRNDVELVVGFEIDGDSALRVEDNFIVVFDLATDSDNSAGDGWDFGSIREGDPTFGFPFGFVFEDQNASSDRLDSFKRRFFRHGTLGNVEG